MITLTFTSKTAINMNAVPEQWRSNISVDLLLSPLMQQRYRYVIQIQPDDGSYRYRALMQKTQLVLKFSLPFYVEFPVGTYTTWQNQRFTLMRAQDLKKQGTRKIEYTMNLGTNEDYFGVWKLRNVVDAVEQGEDAPKDNRLKFSLCAKPHEFVDLLVRNLNNKDTSVMWERGECIEASEKTVEFNHSYIDAALTDIANAFNTEYEVEFIGTNRAKIHLRRVEYNNNTEEAVKLAYGVGNGFIPGIGRTSEADGVPVKRMFTQGTDRNIDRSKYGSPELLMPKSQSIRFDGNHFECEEGFNEELARTYTTDAAGESVERTAPTVSDATKEDSLDCSEIYPSRIGVVTDVREVNPDKNFYDIVDSTIPDTLNFNDYLIAGETMTLIMQDGMLAGKEFDVKYIHKEVVNGVSVYAKRFEIVPQEIDGVMMPNATFRPVVASDPEKRQKYAVFGIQLPDEYICNNADKTGASWDMMRAAVRELYKSEDQRFTFTGSLQALYAKRKWEEIGGKLIVGGHVLFSDNQFAKDGVLIRIVGIKDYLTAPYAPTIELSNSVSAGSASVSSQLRQIENTEVIIEDAKKTAIQYTKRRFRDAKETMSMLQSALQSLSDEYTDAVSPIAVKTMQVLLGDESLQFQFVRSLSNLTRVEDTFGYDQGNKIFGTVGTQYIQHLTLGVNSISSSHNDSEYKRWQLPEYTSPVLTESDKSYYVYAVVKQEGQTGYFTLSDTALSLTGKDAHNDDCYNLLCGVINSEQGGERSFVRLYGFTEILPGRITTDRVVSGDGQSYFDMVANAMKLGEALDFNSQGDGTLRLRGTLVQSQSGDESYLGCYRGVYNDAVTYYNGDEVSYESNGCWSTYRQIHSTHCVGIPPTNSLYWQVIAQGAQGAQGISPNTAFKSIVFKRSNVTPSTPTGGSYANPVPNGWSDGIPSGTEMIWMTSRIFSSDGSAPQQATWVTPRLMSDTPDFDVEYSSLESPTSPSGHPNTNTQWGNEADEDTIWMATAEKHNGVWSDWQVMRIKGERGEDGTSINIKGTLSSMSQLPIPPSNPSDCYIIDNDLWVWDGDSWVNAGQFKGEDGKNAYLHIKFAISLSPFQWSANNGETPSNYIGIYCDNSPTDLLDMSKYQWTKWVGDDGFGYEYIYKLTQAATAPSTPSATSQADDFVPTESPVPTGQTAWTDDPQDVSEAYPYCWVCYRKKTDGVWGAFVGSAADNSHAALWAKFGADGADGDYTEYRFKANGSPTTAPTLSFTTTNPDFPTGWTLTLPTLTSTAKYIWMTFAIRDGATGTIKQGWSSPVRISAADGVDGTSPALVYRGTYSATATYYGNEHRVDCVKYGSQWYVARVDAPNGTSGFSAKIPTNTSYWNSFGASFDSVATSLLLADNGNLAGFIFKYNTLVSQKGTINGVASEDFGNASFVPNISIDAVNGIIRQGNNITIDSSGITLYNGSGAITGKITNSSVGDVSGLENMNKTFSTTISYSASGFNSYNTTASNVPLFTHETHIGHCCKGSQIRFTSMAVGFVMPYAFSTSNLTGSQIGIIMRDYVVAVNLYCDNRLVQELGSYIDSRLQSGENFSNNFNTSRTMTVDGGTYPEGVYVLRVECVADALQFGVSSGSSAYYNTTVNLLPRFNYSKAGFTKTLIGNDGMYSCWGDNKFILATAQGIVLRHGSYALRLTDNGIQKSTNGGTSFTNL